MLVKDLMMHLKTRSACRQKVRQASNPRQFSRCFFFVLFVVCLFCTACRKVYFCKPNAGTDCTDFFLSEKLLFLCNIAYIGVNNEASAV